MKFVSVSIFWASIKQFRLLCAMLVSPRAYQFGDLPITGSEKQGAVVPSMRTCGDAERPVLATGPQNSAK